MKRKLVLRILICTVSALLLLGTGMTAWFLLNPEDKRPDTTEIVIPQNGESTKNELALKFEAPRIHPGETLKHTVLLTGEVEGEARINLKFKEDRARVNDLAKYLHTSVSINGTEYCNMLLCELFSAELDTVVCNLAKKDPVVIEISYSMPIEIGNEAEDVEAFFDLLVISSNED